MGSKKVIATRRSKEKTDQEVAALAKEEARKIVHTLTDEDLGGEENQEEEFFNERIIQDEAELRDSQDIFEIGKKMFNAGISVFYRLYKGGQLLGRIEEEDYSWENIQEEYVDEYGKGSYKVQLIDAASGTIRKTQTQILQSPLKSKKNLAEEKERSEKVDVQTLVERMFEKTEAQQRAFEERLMRERENAERRIERDKEKESSSFEKSLTLLTTVLSSQNRKEDGGDKVFEIMMKMQENTNAMMEKMNDKFERMFEKLTDKIADTTKKKDDDGLSPWEMMEKIEKAKNEGMKLQETIMTLADLKAEEKAELLARINGNSDDKEESITDSAIKAALPLLSQFLTKGQGQPMVQPMQTIPANPSQQRRSLPRPNQANLGNARATTIPTQDAKSNTPKAANVGEIESGSRGTSGKTNVVRKKGLPTLEDIEQVPNNSIINPEVAFDPQLKERVGEVLIPVLLNGIQSGSAFDVVGDNCWLALQENKLDEANVTELYSFSELNELGKAVGLSDDWVKGFYEHIKAKTNLESGELAQH